MLEINDSLTPDLFIDLVLEWNRRSPHKENIIPGIEWHGNIRYGEESLWLSIQEYATGNSIAVRYEKVEFDGVVWDTDYVMNFREKKLSILLDRSYREDVQTIDFRFSTLHFIRLLIEKGYLKDDGELPVTRVPFTSGKDNLHILTDIINGQTRYCLPVVYVSKSFFGNDPVDIKSLAVSLKGAAHVLTEESTVLDNFIRRQCGDRNEYDGAIGIYYPNELYHHQKYLYRGSGVYSEKLAEKVKTEVFRYGNTQMIDPLYTWQGVNNALLREQLSDYAKELNRLTSHMHKAEIENEDLLSSVDNEIEKLKQRVDELTRDNERLQYEVQEQRKKWERITENPILFLGTEEEYFLDEIKAMVLDALEDYLNGLKEKTRRYDVIQDLLQTNTCQRTAGPKGKEVIRMLNGCKKLSPAMIRTLEEMGFCTTDTSNHYKLAYYNDNCYIYTLAKTPSDSRTGINEAKRIIELVF